MKIKYKALLIVLIISIYISWAQKPSEQNLKWDFSKSNNWKYALSHVVNGNSKLSKSGTENKISSKMTGNLIVKSNGDSTASLVLDGVVNTLVQYNELGVPEDTIQRTKTRLKPLMMSDSGAFENTEASTLFKFLMPLPNVMISKIDSVKVPMFISNPQLEISASGYNTLIYSGTKKFKGHKCIMLTGIIDISEQSKNNGTIYRTSGKGTYYFDAEEGIYIGAYVNLRMQLIYEKRKTPAINQYIDIDTQNTYELAIVNN